MRVAVLGATGYTGRLVVEEARRAGLPLRLVGRRRDALEALAAAGEEVRVADARDEPALREAFAGAFAVLSLAGPFLAAGPAPVAAAVAAGAHYLDTTGEQAFARLVHERFGEAARAAGVCVLPAFGFDYVPGDLAARLAAEGLEPLDELITAWSVSGSATSRGTKRTVGHVLGQPLLAREDGRLVPTAFGASSRTVRFPFGERTVVEWGSTEALTVPRHTEVRAVRSYFRAPAAARRLGRLSLAAAPLVRLGARLAPAGPSTERRARTRFAVVAEARGPRGAGRAVLAGHDVYATTALLLVRAVEALRDGEARATGVVGPAEAFDVHVFLPRLAPHVVVSATCGPL